MRENRPMICVGCFTQITGDDMNLHVNDVDKGFHFCSVDCLVRSVQEREMGLPGGVPPDDLDTVELVDDLGHIGLHLVETPWADNDTEPVA